MKKVIFALFLLALLAVGGIVVASSSSADHETEAVWIGFDGLSGPIPTPKPGEKIRFASHSEHYGMTAMVIGQ